MLGRERDQGPATVLVFRPARSSTFFSGLKPSLTPTSMGRKEAAVGDSDACRGDSGRAQGRAHVALSPLRSPVLVSLHSLVLTEGSC